jgi:hypothetical protein
MIERNLFKILLTACFAVLLAPFAKSQEGKWQAAGAFEHWVDHLPYNTFEHVDELDPLVFCASQDNLLVIDGSTDEFTRYSRINGLSGTNITALRADAPSQTVWIGYANGRIDVWRNGTFQAINAIEETPSFTGLKQINSFAFFNGKAYAGTNFGLVEFEISSRLAGRTLLLGDNYSPIAVASFDINPAGTACVYSPDQLNDFLVADLTENLPQWAAIDYRVFSSVYDPNHIVWYDVDQCFVYAATDLTSGTLLFDVTEDSNGNWAAGTYPQPWGAGSFGGQEIQDIRVSEDWLVVTRDFNVIGKKSDAQNNPVDSINISNALFAPGVLRPLSSTFVSTENAFYVGNFQTGVLRVKDGTKVKRILPSSPYSNKAFHLVPYGLGKDNDPNADGTNPYAAVYRGNTGGVLHLPGALNELWSKAYSSDGAGRYENQQWTHWDKNYLYGLTDFVSAAHEFTASGERIYLSSWGGGIVELTDGDTTGWFRASNTNGALLAVNGNANDLRTGGLTFDDEGNLWGVQSLVAAPLFKKDVEGNWSNFALSPGADGVALKNILHHDGMFFIQSRTNGIYAYRSSDGLKRQISSGTGSGNLPSNHVLSMAVDQDGELWLGTDEGLVVLYSPSNIFNGGNSDARPILFEEDGVVQKLLGETPITSIFVDGGNRKWIGTRGAGLFLVSPEGLQTVQQFTATNSPLLSNDILSIAADPTSGELLIATSKGLIGYRGDATPGYTGNVPEASIYPNPVRPGYEGPIFVQGCPEGAVVKFTDVTGALVFETQSNGGTARWNGTNLSGQPAASGVYLVYITDALGTVTAQGKVLVIRQ